MFKLSAVFRALSAVAVLVTTVTAPLLYAATCPFDTGGSDALNDGVVLTRYALGITGAPLINSTKYASLDPLQVKNNIECVGCALDMNGDGKIDAVDTTIIARHLMGFTGASLTAGLALGVAPSSSRVDAAAVTSFLANGCAVGGAIGAFVNGGNSFGAAAVLQTNDGFPLSVGVGGTSGGGLRIFPATYFGSPAAPNIVIGSQFNSVTTAANLEGNTISGGGGNERAGSLFANSIVGTSRFSTIAGGTGHTITSVDGGTISGGKINTVIGLYGTVIGGFQNYAGAALATVLGGDQNAATGVSSAAAGHRAKADKTGAFVWADSVDQDFKSSVIWPVAGGADSFSVRATGGVTFVTKVNTTTGATLAECYLQGSPAVLTSGWTCTSDRNAKERIMAISPQRVLESLVTMPVSEWSMIGSTMRQIGPMAQDFYRAFGLGDSDKAINSINAQGVAFAAIQGLNLKLADQVKTKDSEITKLKARLVAIEKKLGL